ncbi:porin family protein [Devosia sp. MC532]|nr:outer membrane beta-barrel protein [Devosia sp. MC532]MBJ7577513.1 porin family protein [Devosia sp. MC532]
MNKLILFVVLAAGTAGPTWAQDNHDWSGFYAGVSGVYTTSQNDKSFVTSPDRVRNSFGMEGAMLGVQAGYLTNFENFVLGVEGSVLFGKLNGNDNHNGSSYEEMTVNNLASLTARFGYAFDSVLLYGKVGVSTGSVNMLTYESHLPDTDRESMTSQYVGPTIGAGVDVALNDNISVRAEYNLHFLGRKEHPWAYWSDAIYKIDKTQDVRIGINYKF